MTAPTWLAATPNQPAEAGQVNQFLTSHTTRYLYDGTIQSDQTTPGSGSTTSNSLWMAQQFTSGAAQTLIGRVVLTLSVAGTPAPLTLQLRASLTGAPLATTLLPREFLTSTAFGFSVPLPATLTASTDYFIVAEAVGDSGNHYVWGRNDQSNGAFTSPDGTTWTAQSYGLAYQENDQAATGNVRHTYEDTGARWSAMAYTNGEVTKLDEYTTAQGGGYLASERTLTYSEDKITEVS